MQVSEQNAERLTRLEIRMDFLERETMRQTQLLEKQDIRLSRMEKVLWTLLGGLLVVEFIVKIGAEFIPGAR